MSGHRVETGDCGNYEGGAQKALGAMIAGEAAGCWRRIVVAGGAGAGQGTGLGCNRGGRVSVRPVRLAQRHGHRGQTLQGQEGQQQKRQVFTQEPQSRIQFWDR